MVMLNPLKRLVHYDQKRTLCLEIAKTYKDRSKNNFSDAVDAPQQIMKSLSPDSSRDMVELHQGISAYALVGLLMAGREYSEDAEKYEHLANSWRLYVPGLISIKSLQEELKNPRKGKTIKIPHIEGAPF